MNAMDLIFDALRQEEGLNKSMEDLDADDFGDLGDVTEITQEDYDNQNTKDIYDELYKLFH
jgi:hypothetical protein